MDNKRKVVLAILDGFGIGDENNSNAIFKANTPFFDKLFNTTKFAKLDASEEQVGLPKNKFGNSELGHMTIGSGRTIYGINDRFNKIINDNKVDEFLKSQEWVKNLLNNNNIVHICGIYSKGCVHGNLLHIETLINFFEKNNKKVALYLISDGRDTSRFEFKKDLSNLLPKLKSTTKIVALSGRYYAMDRDNNFDRTNLFYQAMNQNKEFTTPLDYLDYIEKSYSDNIDDEFIYPVSFIQDEYKINQDDTIIFTNYRSDRIRQIIQMFEFDTNIPNTKTDHKCKNLIGLCEYPKTKLTNVIFEKEILNDILGEVISKNNIKQLRVAETEKFAHVTFFFDGGRYIKYENHDEILISSKSISAYNLAPEMSANEITDTIISNLDNYDLIITNYANADMVGHTGDFEATKKAIEILDKQCATLYNNVVDKYNGTLIITSDHGNADYMIDSENNVVKTHSIAKVPMFVLSNNYEIKKAIGKLQDIAPSILFIYNLNKPINMSGENLLKIK